MFEVDKKISIVGQRGQVCGIIHKVTEKAICVKVSLRGMRATDYFWFPISQLTSAQGEAPDQLREQGILAFDVPSWMSFDGKRVNWPSRANRSSYYANNAYYLAH